MKAVSAVFSLVFLASACALLSAEMIDFGSALPGAPTGHSVVLTNQLSSYGLTFSTTHPQGVYWFGPGYSWPPAHYSIASGDLGQFLDPIRVDFASPVIQVSIRGFDGGGDVDTLTLTAFNSGDSVVDSHIITNDFDVPGSTAMVSGPGITYVTFQASGSNAGLFFDDLSYVVPEPATAALLGIGAISLFIRRRRSCLP